MKVDAAKATSDQLRQIEAGTWLECLRRLERVTYILKYKYDFTHDEIAKMNGVTSGTIKTEIHRIQEKLNKMNG